MALGRLRPNYTPDTPEGAVGVYDTFYGRMPIPATDFTSSSARLASPEAIPSVRTVASNASVVDRHNRLNGLVFTGGRRQARVRTPQHNRPVFSSAFQNTLMGPHVNYIINKDWYIAYPAATVMLGGQRNQALSTRVDQIPTRVTGGPGPAAMGPAPRFKSVQTVPRYSTIPTMYNTSPADS